MKKQNSWLILLAVLIVIGFIVLIARKPSSSSSSSGQSQSSPAAGNGAVTTSIANSPYLGDKSQAKVAIVEFSDYECPYCQMFFEQTFDGLVKEYVNTDKAIFVYRDFLGVGLPAAEVDSNAALCVRNLKDNSAYFQMAKLIYENTGLEGQGIPTDKMVSLAGQVGVDQTKFKTCLSNDQFKNQIRQDNTDALSAGVSGTPAFVIGKLASDGKVTGELVVGAQPIATFESTINKYLQ